MTARETIAPDAARKFALGDRVTKTKGSAWTGKVVGFYSTELTPVGYAVESETERGSVQIYPEAALTAAGYIIVPTGVVEADGYTIPFELVQRVENRIAYRISLGSTPRAIAEDVLSLASPHMPVPAGLVLVPEEPTVAQTYDACMSYRHDFGILRESDREATMRTAKWWLEAWRKALSSRPKGGA